VKEAVDPGGSSVRVGEGQDAYTVLVGRDLLEDLPSLLVTHVEAHRYAIVTDDHVAPLHTDALSERCREAGLDATLLTFPAGESSKTRKSWSILTDEMLEAGFGRDSCVVGVGGGVTTDLAGFVAATYMRGVPVVQVPTTYLAMIDASVGGKTGVDVRAGKNLVGAFHAPTLVVADLNVLATLPREERAQGLVEAFKHGVILDAAYFEELTATVDQLLAADAEAAHRAVLRSVELKAGVVTEDEREAGYRQVLNFGHTVGHALEAASDFELGHGSAVALGMAVEARLGEALGVTEPGTAARLEACMSELLEPEPRGARLERVAEFLGADKKRRLGGIRCVLLRGIGRVDPGEGWTHSVPEAIVIEALEGYLAAR
jgi:3-dehydroquinate synthase